MANPEHLAILKQGVKVWNEWRTREPSTFPDLRKANLSRIFFMGANLDHANLSYANLADADLTDASFHHADMADANLTETKLENAYLTGAYIRKCKLDRTALTNAVIGWTTFSDIDLRTTHGLDVVVHEGPSTIGIDTIYRSGGNIAESFLRGCGVPDEIIALSLSLKTKSSKFFSCFISHSSKDKHFCERFYADLQANGVRVWYFPEDAKWGEPVWGEIDRSIKVYDKLIVVCSKNALTSVPVLREIERALNREDREHKNILFPITIDDYLFDEWDHPRQADVLAKVVGDFRGSHREVSQYAQAFKKFLEAVKAA